MVDDFELTGDTDRARQAAEHLRAHIKTSKLGVSVSTPNLLNAVQHSHGSLQAKGPDRVSVSLARPDFYDSFRGRDTQISSFHRSPSRRAQSPEAPSPQKMNRQSLNSHSLTSLPKATVADLGHGTIERARSQERARGQPS